jgi:prepilin-type N-terminal cleavage/methylation domain-containing protein
MNRKSNIVNKRSQFGYTMLELILVIVLIGIIAGVLTKMFIWGVDIFNFVSSRKDVVQSSRIGMEIFVKDLRYIKNPNDIIFASNKQFRFYNSKRELIVYKYSDGKVTRNKNNMIEGLTSFQFSYYDINSLDLGLQVKNPDNIWKIKISIESIVNNKPFALESMVMPRNFGLN